MCHLIPASFSNRTDSGVQHNSSSNAMKITSVTEGISHRIQPRCCCSSEELLESSTIALNLIRWSDEQQGNKSHRYYRCWLRWPECRAHPGSRVGPDHRHRSQEPPHIS